jgi:hypothetical protein
VLDAFVIVSLGANFAHQGEGRMPVDPTIRRLADDPDCALAIRAIDSFFAGLAERMDAEPGLGADTAESIIEFGWKMMKRGLIRLYGTDPGDDDDADDSPLVVECETPGQRSRARVMGAKLFAVRQRLRRRPLSAAAGAGF